MTTNPILQELYAVRADIMAEYGNDLGAYLRDAAERNTATGHPVAKIDQRTLRCSGPAKADEPPPENFAVSSDERKTLDPKSREQ